jgi:hypothetical protein
MMDTYESTIAVAIAEGEAGEGETAPPIARDPKEAPTLSLKAPDLVGRCEAHRQSPFVLTADDVGRAAVGFLKVTKLMTLWLAII